MCKLTGLLLLLILFQAIRVSFRVLVCVLLGIQKLEKCDWTPMAEQAINVVYFLAEHPDVICGNIVKQLAGCLTQKEDPRDDDATADGQEQGIYRHVY